ncbi:baseplate J/gp47 family protein [Brevibacillus laterosporus]|uniref:baseplate J/gp47 family protein n=1 Tax=Brevibacillus laterosporus TaxID=1465 RepID=UPI0018CE40A7|nr:baseplate J/gp47 family protein [Brevibacillus laterosporus]MCR8940422.1 baseplate J/gp47 family protein [Brevibacillus laterosporus]MCZ0843061.1 baseplate J/gp47 family protein [Brevibacillus laterosporus]MCZ0847661.1 baseplate J/gp47 family protein [Brevibacillus laterosporus]MED1913324.1 baseplate J/gp47 family protein [Brevibacillus laterosporus]
MPAGQTTVEVEAFCFVAGEFGNLTPATKVFPGMTEIEYVKYVEPIVAGVDRESDDHLRERLLTEVQNMEKGGTEIDYEIWAKRVKGVVSARSIPLARGNGTVDVIITGTVGLPTQQLIKDVQSYIDTKTPSGGADVLVKAPTPVAVDVSVNIKVVQGYEFETVRSLVEEAIREAIVLENKVFVVRVSRLQTIIGEIPSVFTYKLLSPPEDIVLSGTDLAIPGAITVTEVI